jgi:hypothetical protein
VADYLFTRRFVEELSVFEKSVSPNDLRLLEEVLAAIVDNPDLPGRVPSFYDPTSPSYLYRSEATHSFPRATPESLSSSTFLAENSRRVIDAAAETMPDFEARVGACPLGEHRPHPERVGQQRGDRRAAEAGAV